MHFLRRSFDVWYRSAIPTTIARSSSQVIREHFTQLLKRAVRQYLSSVFKWWTFATLEIPFAETEATYVQVPHNVFPTVADCPVHPHTVMEQRVVVDRLLYELGQFSMWKGMMWREALYPRIYKCSMIRFHMLFIIARHIDTKCIRKFWQRWKVSSRYIEELHALHFSLFEAHRTLDRQCEIHKIVLRILEVNIGVTSRHLDLRAGFLAFRDNLLRAFVARTPWHVSLS